MLIAPKRLKIQTSNLASMLPSKSWHHDMTTEKNSGREHGKGHVTATTVPCKLQQWDRYRVPQNVFLCVIRQRAVVPCPRRSRSYKIRSETRARNRLWLGRQLSLWFTAMKYSGTRQAMLLSSVSRCYFLPGKRVLRKHWTAIVKRRLSDTVYGKVNTKQLRYNHLTQNHGYESMKVQVRMVITIQVSRRQKQKFALNFMWNKQVGY